MVPNIFDLADEEGRQLQARTRELEARVVHLEACARVLEEELEQLKQAMADPAQQGD